MSSMWAVLERSAAEEEGAGSVADVLKKSARPSGAAAVGGVGYGEGWAAV